MKFLATFITGVLGVSTDNILLSFILAIVTLILGLITLKEYEHERNH